MNNYIEDLKQEIIRDKKPVVLFGAGDIGEMCDFSFQQHNIKVDFFATLLKKNKEKFFAIKKSYLSG